MRKRPLLILIFCACVSPLLTLAQINLVKNPSFEQYARCQTRINNIKYCNYWTPIADTVFSSSDTLGPGMCTPEYSNTCVPFYCQTSIPLSYWYFHYPRTGNGMAHIITYYKEDYDTTATARRDYLQGRLRDVLTNGHNYSCFFFYITSAGVWLCL